MGQRKFNPARDACTVLWDVLWDDLVTMELTRGKKDQQGSLPSRLILYLQMRSAESNTIRVIKCCRGSEQASDIYSSIQQALNTYGPYASKVYILYHILDKFKITTVVTFKLVHHKLYGTGRTEKKGATTI